MGRFRTFKILLTLGALGGATEGALAQTPGGSAPATRPEPPAQPSEYVKALDLLYKRGDFRTAAKYAKAANQYRDRLNVEEQTLLDQYRAELTRIQSAGESPGTPIAGKPAPAAEGSGETRSETIQAATAGAAPATDATRIQAAGLLTKAREAINLGRFDDARALARQADALNVSYGVEEDSPARVLAEIDGRTARAVSSPGGAGGKSKAIWLLHAAREQMRLGNLDEAAKRLAEARSISVRYNFFDLTPDKVAVELAKARQAKKTDGAVVKGDKRQARAKLREARAALSAGRIDQAETIANEVAGWGLRYGIWEESPKKIMDATRASRSREALRTVGSKAQARPEIYAVLVRQAREAMAAGKTDEAKKKAEQALAMNVVVPVNADRAEAVLNDLAMASVSRAPAADPNVQLAKDAEPAQNPNPAAAPTDGPAPIALENAQPAPADQPKAGDPTATQPERTAIEPPTNPPAEAERPAQAPAEQPAPAPAPLEQPAPAPADEPAPAPAPAEQPAPAESPQPEANKGEQLLEQARALYARGNYGEARDLANEAKTGGFGVETKAEEMIAQIGLGEQQAALSAYEAALAAARKGDNSRALALLNEVAAAENLDEGIKQRVQDLLSRLPKQDGKKTAAETVDDAEAVRAQKLNVEVGTRLAEARRLLETDPDKAIALLQKTIESVQAAEVGKTVSKTLVRRLEVQIENAKRDKVAFDQKMKEKKFREEIERKRLRILEADKSKHERMDAIMAKAQQAEVDGKYAEAEALARKAMEIDPMDVAANAMAYTMRVRRHYDIDKQNRLDKDESFLNVMQDVDSTMNVPNELIKNSISYPSGFAELAKRPTRSSDRLYPVKSPAARRIEAKLNEPITINWKNQPLGEAIDFLRNYTGLNIHLDGKALADESRTEADPVTLIADKMSLKKALQLMLSPLGLTYRVDDEVLMITSPQTTRNDLIVRAYDVADLVISPHSKIEGDGTNPLQQPELQGVKNSESPEQKAARNAAMNSNPVLSAMNNGASASVEDKNRADMMPLVTLITNAVAPGTWRIVTNPYARDDDGYDGMGAGFAANDQANQQIGTITPFYLNISLIIRHTAEVQEQVVDLLRQLRKLQDLQVSVEVRFITVSDSFFEYFAVDFEFNILSNAYGKKSSFAALLPGNGNLFSVANLLGGGAAGGIGGAAGGIGGAAGGIGGAAGGIGGAAGGIGGAAGGAGGIAGGTTLQPYIFNPVRDHTYGPKEIVVGRAGPGTANGNFSPDLSIPFNQQTSQAIVPFNATIGGPSTFGIAFLSDLELYLYLSALQGDVRNNIVQAPKVTTFNGARAIISNNTQRSYVAALFPIVGFGAVAFLPTVSQIPDGVILSVIPVVTADRRYVRLSIAPQFLAFDHFDTFIIPGAVGGGGLGGGATSINGQIQLPIFNQTNVNTTVTVPDGGTVLLGGVKRLQESRTELGTPIVSKIPFIDRLFRNIGVGRQTSSLMLMVTPRIVILEEEEERLGIPSIVPTVSF